MISTASVRCSRFDAEPDVSIRRALLLALGEFSERQLSVSQRNPFVKRLLAVYETDPDPGLHGSAEWLLRKWKRGREINQLTQKLQTNEDRRKTEMKDGKRRWYVNTQGQTFAVIMADVFRMGSPRSEPGRDNDETPHLRKIGRTFAIAAHEVTREQFARLQSEDRTIRRFNITQFSRTADSPQVAVDWYDAAAYCNWLSKKEGIPEDQWCYEKNAQGKYAAGMKAKKNYLQLTGYRLPTEAEWEYACRAGTVTSRYYGLTETLLPQYAWYQANADNHAWQIGGLRPNSFGLFDMLGNVFEWCHDAVYSYGVMNPDQSLPENMDTRTVIDSGARLLRGGSFGGRPSFVRSAYRVRYRPSSRDGAIGFRASRTLPLAPLTPLLLKTRRVYGNVVICRATKASPPEAVEIENGRNCHSGSRVAVTGIRN